MRPPLASPPDGRKGVGVPFPSDCADSHARSNAMIASISAGRVIMPVSAAHASRSSQEIGFGPNPFDPRPAESSRNHPQTCAPSAGGSGPSNSAGRRPVCRSTLSRCARRHPIRHPPSQRESDEGTNALRLCGCRACCCGVRRLPVRLPLKRLRPALNGNIRTVLRASTRRDQGRTSQ